MSKSIGNIVPIDTGAQDMYGKLMSVPDFAMGAYLRLVTRWTPPEIDEILKGIESGITHPRDAKMRMALEVVSIFYGNTEAQAAEQAFVHLFQHKETPENMDEFVLVPGATIIDVLIAAGLATSKSEGEKND